MGGNFQKRSVGPFLDLLPFKGPFPLTGALTGRPPYGKAPYGEASYGKAPYGEASSGRRLQLQESLREGWALTGNPLQGGTVLTGRAGHYRRVLYGDGSLHRDEEEAYEKAGPLRAGGTVLTGRGESLGLGPFTEKDDEEAYGRLGPYGKPFYGEERSLREGPVLTKRSLTGRAGVLYGAGSFHREQRPLITGKLTGSYGEGLLPELGGNFRLCAVDQKRSFFASWAVSGPSAL